MKAVKHSHNCRIKALEVSGGKNVIRVGAQTSQMEGRMTDGCSHLSLKGQILQIYLIFYVFLWNLNAELLILCK